VFGSKIKLDKDLLSRAKQASDQAGYSSVEEFVAHCVEKELARINKGDDDDIVSRLEGLGYIA
jgi:hypothetical protein